MRKLIYLDTAIDAVLKESNADGAYGYMDTKSIVDLLNDLPSAQPEILRCKDCIYWWESHKMCKRNKDKNHNCACMDCDADFYCKYAERRTDERTD